MSRREKKKGVKTWVGAPKMRLEFSHQSEAAKSAKPKNANSAVSTTVARDLEVFTLD